MRIAVIVEGQTEAEFLRICREFLRSRLVGRMPNLHAHPYDGLIPRGAKLKQAVDRLLSGNHPADAVIALTDVYTGSNPPEFRDAAHAKEQMQSWVGDNPAFHPHAAQYEFEAWLIPFWSDLAERAGSRKSAPGSPEQVNHGKPPSKWIGEMYSSGTRKHKYLKTRDAAAVLRVNDLTIAANACPELKAFLNTILKLYQGTELP